MGFIHSQALSIPGRIEYWADQAPKATAIEAPQRRGLSFERLRNQIETFAWNLQALGVERGDRVVVVLPNGPEMAVAFLAISSVAVFAPLNPDYRATEFEFYFSDLNPKALVALSGSSSPALKVAHDRHLPVFLLQPDADDCAGSFSWKPVAGQQEGQLLAPSPEDVALILHTSGTTSRPKMVPLTHKNLCSSATNIANSLQLTAGDRCLNIMPLFHIHGLIGALLSSLVSGGAVMCTPGLNVPLFNQWMNEWKPTWYTAVPTMHRAILGKGREKKVNLARYSLRLVRSSSAALPASLTNELEAAWGCPVIEAYGMTEASHQIASNPLPPGKRKAGSVGTAAGTEICILGESGQFLPPKSIGEVVIRGSNVTSGYEAADGIRVGSDLVGGWFRTGDQGYLDEEGYLYLTGRIKEIINRGGEKISPREIDDVLMDHPAVQQAITFALPDARLGEDVAAAVSLRENTSATEAEIREFTAFHLADFKVPRRVLILPELPIGPTGKLQRIRLADQLGLAAQHVDYASDLTGPRSSTEAIVHRIWQDVLKIESIGIHEDFLAAGGDSILASLIASRLSEAFHMPVSPLQIFDHPTIASLSAIIEKSVSSSHTEEETEGLVHVPVAAGTSLPVSSLQEQLWFLDLLQPNNPAYNRPAAFRIQGNVDIRVLQKCLREIERRHEVLRTSFQAEDGQPSQKVSDELRLKVRVIDLTYSQHSESGWKRIIAQEARSPFRLDEDPLIRVSLYRIGAESILLIVMHHIISDGWSSNILFEELSTLYHVFSQNQPSPLPEPPIQYSDFSRWLRRNLSSKEMEEGLSFWKSQLSGDLPLLQLPLDHSRPPLQTHDGAAHFLQLNRSLSDQLAALSRQENVTLFMTMLAAFEVLLFRYSEQTDIIVGTPSAGRNRIELEKLIGLFTNSLALRVDLSGDPSFSDLLQRVRKISLAALAHQDVPFAQIVKALNLKRDLSCNPIFQVLFQHRNVPRTFLNFPGTKVEHLNLDFGITTLDLIAEFSDAPEGIVCQFEYNKDLFDSPTIVTMIEHYHTLLNLAVNNPKQKISMLAHHISSSKR